MRVCALLRTNGGGWTIVHSVQAGNTAQEVKLKIDNEKLDGNPLKGEDFRLSFAKKEALSALTSETLYLRSSATWLKTNKPLFAGIEGICKNTASHKDESVTITRYDGTTTSGVQGISCLGSSSGGDFGLKTGSFDHHAPSSYNHLQNSCRDHFIYAYGSCGGYKVHETWGTWTQTHACTADCGGDTITFYVAQR